jgi:hypothetical protein
VRMPLFNSATFLGVCAETHLRLCLHADPDLLQQLALQWLREFVLPPPPAVTILLPSSLLHCSLLSQVVT